MKKTEISIIYVLILLGVSLLGEAIPAQEVQKIRDIIRLIESDLDSARYDEDLKIGLSHIVTNYGIEGIATISLEEPVFMQALMISPSFGYEKLAESLLRQARDEVHLEQMLLVMTFAKLAIGQDLRQDLRQDLIGSNSMKAIKDAVSLSLGPIGDKELEQTMAAVSVAALEHTSKNSAEITGTHSLETLRTKLAELTSDAFFFIRFDDSIIGQVEHFPKAK